MLEIVEIKRFDLTKLILEVDEFLLKSRAEVIDLNYESIYMPAFDKNLHVVLLVCNTKQEDDYEKW
jgi:hypothetical protein